MNRVLMPPDTNQETTKTIKRSVAEAWPGFDEEQFRADLAEQNRMLDALEMNKRRNQMSDAFVNLVVVVGFVFCAILLVSGA